MKYQTARTFIFGFVAGAAIFASSSSFAATAYEKITNAYINHSVKINVDGQNLKLNHTYNLQQY